MDRPHQPNPSAAADEPAAPAAPPSRPARALDLERLAGPPDALRWDLGEKTTAGQPQQRLCVFSVGRRMWGLEGRFSVGIQSISNPTPIPLTPSYLVGLAHVRGALMPVLDLSAALGDPETPRRLAEKDRIADKEQTYETLVLRVDEIELCLVVDAVAAFEHLPIEATAPDTALPGDLPPGWIQGRAEVPEHGTVPVLDLARLVDSLRLRPPGSEIGS